MSRADRQKRACWIPRESLSLMKWHDRPAPFARFLSIYADALDTRDAQEHFA